VTPAEDVGARKCNDLLVCIEKRERVVSVRRETSVLTRRRTKTDQKSPSGQRRRVGGRPPLHRRAACRQLSRPGGSLPPGHRCSRSGPASRERWARLLGGSLSRPRLSQDRTERTQRGQPMEALGIEGSRSRNARVQRSECEIQGCLSLIGWRKVMALCRPASGQCNSESGRSVAAGGLAVLKGAPSGCTGWVD
jgi:hypothetical protein